MNKFNKQLLEILLSDNRDFLDKAAFINHQENYVFQDLIYLIFEYLKIIQNYSDQILGIEGKTSFNSYAFIIACFILNKDFTILLDLDKEEKERRIRSITDIKIFLIDPKNIHINNNKNSDLEFLIDNLKIYLNKDKKESSLYMFSSGSTGIPKVIRINQNKFLDNYTFSYKNKTRKVLLLLLIDHIGGLNTILSTFTSFDTLVLPKSKDCNDIVDILKISKAEILPGSPTFLNILLNHNDFNHSCLNNLKIITYGTEKMPDFIINRLKENFPKIKLIQTFGTTETGIIQMKMSKNHDSIKFANRDEFKIIDNILFLRSNLDATYLNAKNSSFNDGWFNTGDLVKLNKDGSITIIGRIKDVINVGGQKVTPQEIENIVGNIEGIEDVLCYPIPNPITNQAVGVKIKIKNESDFNKLKKLIRKEFIIYEKFKRPVLIEKVENISYSQRGKKIRI